MSKLINTILLSATLLIINGSNNEVYAGSDTVKTMYYDMLTSSYDNLKGYKINEAKNITDPNDTNKNIPNPLYGAIYDQRTDGYYYLVDDNNNKFFDLQTRIGTITADSEELTNPEGVGTLNLIVFKFDKDSSENIYTLSNSNDISKSSTHKFLNIKLQNSANLIIPNKITLNYKDIRLTILSNSSVLILGTLLNKNIEDGNFAIILFSDNDYNHTIIIGKHATYNNCKTDNVIRCSKNTKVLLYPGCVVEDKSNAIPNKNNTIFKYKGNLYLNRYNNTNNKDKLNGTIPEEFNVIYPKIIKTSPLYEIKEDTTNNPEYTKTYYFPNIYWIGNSHKECDINDGTYHFEEPELPLLFNYNEELNKNILGINKYNEFAKYDIVFWEECKINGSYGIEKYNKLANKGNYFNVDDAYKLFYGVKNSKKPLKFNTDTIYLGLIGNRDVKLKTNENTVNIYGDNRNFKGSLIVPSQIKNIQYYDEYSIIKDIWKLKENNKGIDLKFYSYSFNISYMHSNCDCKNNKKNNNEINKCEKYNKSNNNNEKYLIEEDDKESEMKNKTQEQNSDSNEDNNNSDVNMNDKSKEDGKYLWELCKDGKFRKYYIENDNK